MISRIVTYWLLTVLLGLSVASTAKADVGTTVARETAEFVIKKFGRKILTEGTESFAERLVSSASRHGDDVFAAVRRIGPKALSLADEAGEEAPKLMRLLSKHGDDAAVWVAKRPAAMQLFSRYGDDAAEVLIKHKGLAEPVLEKLGEPAMKALEAVGPRSGRRLAMMVDGGELSAIGHTPELMQVITRHGDAAMDFIWRNKGPLAVGTTLTAFLVQPEPFINGTTNLAGAVAKPLIEETGRAISGLIWAVVAIVIGVPAAGVYLSMKNPKLAAEMAKGAFSLGVKGRR